MLIYLCRHGQAESRAASDRERQLTAAGRADNRRLAAQLQARAPEIDLALCSPYPRAQQTAEDLQSVLSPLRFNASDSLTPGYEVRKLVSLLDDLAETTNIESVILVGHNPLFSSLLNLLLEGEEQGSRMLGTSHLACIEGKFIAPGFAELRYLLTP